MPISEIREGVSQGLLDFAWRQWAQIGVSATAGGATSGRSIQRP